ncbi:MAG: single-stranded DNA-binding protein [Anaerococcus sp.]|nr:single-stranded DNA-binding protein [Peptoniphilaceae bacterium]MDY3055593.1 single-stranded DNA-binding protein [Anaerococcus sp.]
MNKVIISGRLVKDPELRYTKSGTAVTSFSLAVDKGLSKDKRDEAEANNRPTADFPRINVWGKQGENASRYLHKGSKCLIEGRIQTGSYTDLDGHRVFTTDVVAERVEYLDSQNQAQNNAQGNNYNSAYNSTGSNGENYTEQNNDDFFEDDFIEVSDDGVIPF